MLTYTFEDGASVSVDYNGEDRTEPGEVRPRYWYEVSDHNGYVRGTDLCGPANSRTPGLAEMVVTLINFIEAHGETVASTLRNKLSPNEIEDYLQGNLSDVDDLTDDERRMGIWATEHDIENAIMELDPEGEH